jgi:hypothetical protein
MDPEGMVHAVECLTRWLKPEGVLVDIHPTGRLPQAEVWSGDGRAVIGDLQECDSQNYYLAGAAIDRAVTAGLYALTAGETFAFLYHAPTLGDMLDYACEHWRDLRVDAATAAQIEAALGPPGSGRELVVREEVRITRLNRVAGDG